MKRAWQILTRRSGAGLTMLCLTGPVPAWADPVSDPLARAGFRATAGAAAGYLADRACAMCHADKHRTYQHVGMARPFARPSDAVASKSSATSTITPPSQRYYLIRQQGEELFFRRYRRDAQDEPINLFDVRIDWVMGSGNRARSYLYQTDRGEPYELPLGWYSEFRAWGMSPGFEKKDHPGILRRVPRQRMFCHNAFPEMPADSDAHGQPHTFPRDLPQGTGCQRCHGPGAGHVRAALSGSDVETVHGHIVNPRKPPPGRRDQVCFQCHMLPAVAQIGVRRFGRADYSFRPGQRLSDYLVHVAIDELNVARADRFEINHHGCRLWQSRCYKESKGTLASSACHDPHVKKESREYRAQVGGVCRGCHANHADIHPAGTTSGDGRCVGCHMPTRRTRDVAQVAKTDHRIARGPFDAEELTRPLTKRDPIITGVELLSLGRLSTGSEVMMYQRVSVLRTRSTRDAMEALRRSLSKSGHPSTLHYMNLGKAQLQIREFIAAEETVKSVLKHQPDLHLAHTQLGTAQLVQGRIAEAMAYLGRSLSLSPRPAAHHNLALAALNVDRYELALAHLESAIALPPKFNLAWMYKGRINARSGKWETARQALVRSLKLDPANTPAYVDLVRLLRRQGDSREADRYLSVGLR